MLDVRLLIFPVKCSAPPNMYRGVHAGNIGILRAQMPSVPDSPPVPVGGDSLSDLATAQLAYVNWEPWSLMTLWVDSVKLSYWSRKALVP